ncbi:hypothetical protein QR680_006481 [Steinernema hermaphroditum]|uniref:Activin types I and II receptor domain-containing protein n=1 Tax=Steinernema hermaphroditum TaxID=289476 RepID=A0AA39HVQ9_9BILA|nr:hypothetical protein QR680_006481 [Steinernema hermaphroditum]
MNEVLFLLLLFGVLHFGSAATCYCNQHYWTFHCQTRGSGIGVCQSPHCIIAQSKLRNRTITTYKCGPARIDKDECFSHITNFGSLERVCYCNTDRCNTNEFIENYFRNVTGEPKQTLEGQGTSEDWYNHKHHHGHKHSHGSDGDEDDEEENEYGESGVVVGNGKWPERSENSRETTGTQESGRVNSTFPGGKSVNGTGQLGSAGNQTIGGAGIKPGNATASVVSTTAVYTTGIGGRPATGTTHAVMGTSTPHPYTTGFPLYPRNETYNGTPYRPNQITVVPNLNGSATSQSQTTVPPRTSPHPLIVPGHPEGPNMKREIPPGAGPHFPFVQSSQDSVRLMRMEVRLNQERSLLHWILALLIVCLVVLLVLASFNGFLMFRMYPLLLILRGLTPVEKISPPIEPDRKQEEPLFTRTVTSPPPPYQKPHTLPEKA